jgi:hypothetical protein
MIQLGEHPERLLDRAHDVVDVGFEQGNRAAVVGELSELGDHRAAIIPPFFGLVLRMVNPVALGRERPGLRDHVGAAQVLRVAQNLL